MLFQPLGKRSRPRDRRLPSFSCRHAGARTCRSWGVTGAARSFCACAALPGPAPQPQGLRLPAVSQRGATPKSPVGCGRSATRLLGGASVHSASVEESPQPQSGGRRGNSTVAILMLPPDSSIPATATLGLGYRQSCPQRTRSARPGPCFQGTVVSQLGPLWRGAL